MANSKDNIKKYATSFIGFDEAIGNVYDNIGGYVGTVYNAPTRVAGWNGKGSAMSFNGTNQSVQFSNYPIQYEENISLNLKVKTNNIHNSEAGIFQYGKTTAEYGFYLFIIDNILTLQIHKGIAGVYDRVYTTSISDGQWHDIKVKIKKEIAEVYIDEHKYSAPTLNRLHGSISNTLSIGSNTNNSAFFKGEVDSVELYHREVSTVLDKHLVLHNNQYKYHNGTSWLTTTATEANFIQYGMNDLSHITEAQWAELTGSKSIAVWSDFEDKQYASIVLEKEPFKAKDLIGDNAELVLHTTSNAEQNTILTEVDGYSVYDYISELPTVVAYTESTDDITVSTTTEPFDLYDEFGDEVEVLYYTDDEAVTEADLILEANWSPVDELDGDLEVVTWTDEPQETAQRVLKMTAIPKPQFIRLVDPKRLYGYLDDVVAVDDSMSYRDEIRYFITGTDTSKWYVWDKLTQKFVLADISTNDLVFKNGMKYSDLNNITDTQWRTWQGQYLNIGIFLKDNPRDTIVSVVESLSYEDYLPRHSTTIENTSLYILNTTAKIDLQMVGNTLTGVLSDDDLTRVQYRVLINGNSYFPSDGSFTALGASPQNIELTVQSKDIKIDDWNTIRVEFQDFFGTTDYWANSFMGTYSGLMFKDVYGQYYSSEIGEVLQNLDFGVIIAGQTTIEHEVILKNQYGYDVKNLYLYANTSEFPDGMTIQFSESLSSFLPQPELKLNRTLENNEEMSFFVRIKTTLGATPNADGAFDIIVRADRVY